MDTQLAATWVPAADFGTRLLLVRTNLDLTIEEIAKFTGQKAATWSTWERGASPRNMAAVVDAIAETLAVDRDWLMWGGDLGTGPGNYRGNTHQYVLDMAGAAA